MPENVNLFESEKGCAAYGNFRLWETVKAFLQNSFFRKRNIGFSFP